MKKFNLILSFSLSILIWSCAGDNVGNQIDELDTNLGESNSFEPQNNLENNTGQTGDKDFTYAYNSNYQPLNSDRNKEMVKHKRIKVFKSTDEICSTFLPEIEKFLINPFKDTMLTCAKGTKVYFPANVLELPQKIYGDTSVLIEIQEFYNNTDFISRNLSSVSNNDLLESAGMFYVDASLDGCDLALKYEESYVIMRLHTFNTETNYIDVEDNPKGPEITNGDK